jgi:hypothetical protein
MIRSITAIFIVVSAMFVSPGVAISADTIEELKACAVMTDDDARLACFDKLGERALEESSADQKSIQVEKVEPEAVAVAEPEAAAEAAAVTVAAAEAAAETATTIEPLPDDLGSPENVQYSTVVTSCKKGYYGDLYFVFDNGQVWKHTGNRRLRLKECNFNATIMKDAFGYKMQADGIDGSIRVKRNN